MSLLPLDEVRRRLRVVGQAYAGLCEIPVERIVGSVDRAGDFGPDFRPRRGLSRARLASLRSAFPDGDMPPIVVFEVGGAYFVEDGHHRVAIARERGAAFVDAEVTSLRTNYEVPPGVDVCRLMHTEQQRRLLEETGLATARPGVEITFTLLEGYPQLREMIDAHGYALSRRHGRLVPPEDVAADWHDTVWAPAVAAVRRAGLPERYASWRSTDADLALWVCQLLRELRARDPHAGFDAAADCALHTRLGRAVRRHHLRDGSRPLPRREG